MRAWLLRGVAAALALDVTRLSCGLRIGEESENRFQVATRNFLNAGLGQHASLGQQLDVAEQKLNDNKKEFVDAIVEEVAKYKAEARASKQEAEDAKKEELTKMEDECRKHSQVETDKREEMVQKMRHEEDEMAKLMNELGRLPHILNEASLLQTDGHPSNTNAVVAGAPGAAETAGAIKQTSAASSSTTERIGRGSIPVGSSDSAALLEEKASYTAQQKSDLSLASTSSTKTRRRAEAELHAESSAEQRSAATNAAALGQGLDVAEQKVEESRKEFVDVIIEEVAKYKAEARAAKQEADNAKHEELAKMEDECRKHSQVETDKREEMVQKMRHEEDEMSKLMNELGRLPHILNEAS